MSIDKKKNEENLLMQAIRLGRKRGGETARIMRRLSGDEVVRSHPESPDFIKLLPPQSRRSKGTLIGVEHFRVDQNSELMRKSNEFKVNSLGAKDEAKIDKIYEKWHDKVDMAEQLPDELVSDFGNLLASRFESWKKSSYGSFLLSLENSLNIHIQKVEKYRREIELHALPGQSIELAFLVEIHSEFADIFLSDANSTTQCAPGFLPMFEEMVTVLENAAVCVDYIVLLTGKNIYKEEINVLALRCPDIRKSLTKQKVKIYEYISEDRILQGSQYYQKDAQVTPSISREGEEINCILKASYTDIDPVDKFFAALEGYEMALDLLRNGKKCALSPRVHFIMEMYKGIGHVPRYLTEEEFEKGRRAFEEKWLNNESRPDNKKYAKEWTK